LERHFKGHRDTITSVDFNPNMKQLGRQSLVALNVLRGKSRAYMSFERFKG